VVAAGLALTLGPVDEDKPAVGLHAQVKSLTIEPLTAIVAGAPEHIFTVSAYGVQIGGGADADPGYVKYIKLLTALSA
jgi:hypothetical protein